MRFMKFGEYLIMINYYPTLNHGDCNKSKLDVVRSAGTNVGLQ